MAVKPSQSASRVLAVLEKVAEYQPIGISELARLMDEDKSAVQRALATLAQDGWIQTAPGKPIRWQATSRLSAVAHVAHGADDLRRRARVALEALREETGETVGLCVIERGLLIVAEVLESRHPLRVVLPVGMAVPPLASASGRALLAYMSPERQIEFTGGPPDAAELEEYARTVARGYALSSGRLFPGFTNIAAPVFEADGRPIGALLVTGPGDRLPESDHPRVGALVCATARKLSRGQPPSA
jgi:IclR family acetate operon transcriptional repressor